MSSYHALFKYAGHTSLEYGLRIVAFEPDNGEMDAFLGMESVFTESPRGTKRNVYGYKYNNVATIKITLVKQDYSDFTISDNREVLKWLTGNKQATWLDFYDGYCLDYVDDIKPIYKFLGNFVGASQYKQDARVIGIVMTFESVSPWAYLCENKEPYSFNNDTMQVTDNGVLYIGDIYNSQIGVDIDNPTVIVNNFTDNNDLFNITSYNVVFANEQTSWCINNRSDDIYTYIYPNITYTNMGGSEKNNRLIITNKTLQEETHISDILRGECITIDSGKFIKSNIDGKIFGESFHGMKYDNETNEMCEAYCVWPRLQSGENEFIIDGSGSGTVELSYIYPVKIGDCAIDINNLINNAACIEVGGMANMKMRINNGQVEYTVDGIVWHPVLQVSDLASAIGANVVLDSEDTLTIGEQK